MGHSKGNKSIAVQCSCDDLCGICDMTGGKLQSGPDSARKQMIGIHCLRRAKSVVRKMRLVSSEIVPGGAPNLKDKGFVGQELEDFVRWLSSDT